MSPFSLFNILLIIFITDLFSVVVIVGAAAVIYLDAIFLSLSAEFDYQVELLNSILLKLLNTLREDFIYSIKINSVLQLKRAEVFTPSRCLY